MYMNKNNYFILGILLICVLTQFSLSAGADLMQFARADIESGQWWRFITGNLVHLNWRHFSMNAIAFVAIYALYPNVLGLLNWLFVFLISCVAVTFGIWFFSPEVFWYVGLSGALHGILVVLLLLDFFAHRNKLNLVLFTALIAKLIWEAWMGPLPGSENTAGGRIVVQAHFYGFVGGLLLSICILLFNYNKNKKLQL